MFAKLIILGTLVIIVMCLVGGLVFLVRDKGQTKRTVMALSLRIGIAVSLFVFLWIAFHFGWIAPHSIRG